MGFFDFVGDVVGAAVKVAATPLAITKDVVSNGLGVESHSTKDLLKSAGEDMRNAGDEIMPY